MRATLNDVGLPQAVASYDAWGVPETPSIAPFGYTGELQRGSDVWLRARWYGAGRGSFGGRDAYQGDAQQPYSLMPYQYASSNPVLRTDPSGHIDCAPGDMICFQGGYGSIGGGGAGDDLFFHLKKALEVCVAAWGYALGVQTAPQQKEYIVAPQEYVVPEPKKELPGPPVDTSDDQNGKQKIVELGVGMRPDNVINLSQHYPHAIIYAIDQSMDKLALERMIVLMGGDLQRIVLLKDSYLTYTGHLLHNTDVVISVAPDTGGQIDVAMERFIKPGGTVDVILSPVDRKTILPNLQRKYASKPGTIFRDITRFTPDNWAGGTVQSSIGVSLSSMHFVGLDPAPEMYIPTW